MEVRIGVQNVAREIAFESNQSVEEVDAAVGKACRTAASSAWATRRAGATSCR